MTVAELEARSEESRLERFSDRLNPILLKEVRQAMRGRFFKISFWVTLTLATLVGLTVCLWTLMNSGAEAVLGPTFFVAMFACMVVAAQVLVPFSAFLSMSGEWDENTWDLLTLSNLRPRQIVLGKVLSAGVQALLFYSAFGPFLVFAFLLRGIDMPVLLGVIYTSFVLSILLSCVATAMSSFGRGRFARVILMVLLSVLLVWAGVGTVVWAAAMTFNPLQMHSAETLKALAGVLVVSLAVASFFFAAACARLAHPEENRSSGLRLMGLLVVASALGWFSWVSWRLTSADPSIIFANFGIGFLFVISIFFSTEEERLGRRVAASLPRNRFLTLLATPLLPGGARGLLYFIGSSLLVALWMFAFPLLAGRSFPYRAGQPWIPFVLIAHGIFYLGIPGALASGSSRSPAWRSVARVGVLIFFFCSILLPTLIGFFIQAGDWTAFDHPGNVFRVVDSLWERDMQFGGGFYLVLGCLLATLLLNSLRIKRALTEQRVALQGLSKRA